MNRRPLLEAPLRFAGLLDVNTTLPIYVLKQLGGGGHGLIDVASYEIFDPFRKMESR